MNDLNKSVRNAFGAVWPADEVSRRKVADLVPYARNSRTHSDAQIDQIVASIREFGWTTPVLIDESGGIIAGHARVMAAQQIGIEDVPCMVAMSWSDAQKRAYIIADNKLAENAEWDTDLLRIELGDLEEADFDIGLIGFDDAELASIMLDPNAGLTDPDEVPEPPKDPVTVTGDVWLLGKHRLMCGDATVGADVEKLLDGATPHLMVTDPPYGVEYEATWRGKAGHATKGKNRTGIIEHDNRSDWREAWALFPGSIVYVWHGGLMAGLVAESLFSCGFDLRSQIIWNKTVMAMSRGDYHWKHEPCWYAVKGGGAWAGDRKQTTVWDIASPIHIMSGSKETKTPHPSQKPIECMRRPIVNNSKIGDAVYDPFCGSGTTIIAGEMEGRHILAMEIAPEYEDVSIIRWEQFTGKQATLESTGQTFDQVKAERC